MAFTPIDIPIQEILETDFVVDMRIIDNSNFLLLKDKVEDLVNNLEIDTNTLSIGTDTPISYLRTDSLILEDTGFIMQTGMPVQTIAALTKNGSDQSVLNVDILSVDSTIQSDSLSVNALTINDSLQVDGPATFNASTTNLASAIESKEVISAVLIDTLGVATTTITLTNTTRQNIFLTLDADVSVYTGGALVAGLTDINVILDFDATNPPAQNTEFTIYIVDIQSGGTSILIDVNAYPLGLTISAGTNQNTLGNILLHNGSTSSLTVASGGVIEYNSLVSLLYIIDFSSTDRLMVKSEVNMILA
tara:strand:+ start:10956 stop:11870 length:915 start_codon:yes stop_codon:yes gene_type:complete